MSQSEPDSNNHTGVSGRPKDTIENRLRDAGIRVARSVNVADETKQSYETHSDSSIHTYPGLIDGKNHTIHGGDGLVIFDIDADDLTELPDWLRSLPETFTVESPHGGYHLYYALEDGSGISNSNFEWGSIRYENWYTLGPGSILNHGLCEDCDQTGIDVYQIHTDKPIQTLTGDHLEHLSEACGPEGNLDQSERGEYAGEKITLPDEDIAREGEQYICTAFTRHHTELAGSDKMDLLRGGTGSYNLQRDDGTGIDQSATDYYALDVLYGAFLFRGEDESDARQQTLNLFKYYCREKPYDKTGNLRKWLRKGDTYLQEQMDAVQQEFDFGKWHRWRRRKFENGHNSEEQRPWADYSKDGKPSAITEDTVRAALQILIGGYNSESIARKYGLDLSETPSICGEMCPPSPSGEEESHLGYPTAKEVGEMATEINPERKASYFEETLKRLCRRGDVKMAFCPSRPNSDRYVYYPNNLPNPDDARWVRTNGEQYDPEVADGINSWTGESEVRDSVH